MFSYARRLVCGEIHFPAAAARSILTGVTKDRADMVSEKTYQGKQATHKTLWVGKGDKGE